jgi:hypothetical protein
MRLQDNSVIAGLCVCKRIHVSQVCMHRRVISVAALVLTSAALLPAQSDSLPSALLYSDSVSFFVTPPSGWVLDSETGKVDGVLAAVFRRGESWRQGRAVMYANTIALADTRRATFERAVANAATDWAARAGDGAITSLSAPATASGDVPLIKRFVSVRHGAFEAVAYFHHGAYAPILVLTARSQAEFDAAFPAFEAFVRSYGPGPRVVRDPTG